MSEYIEDLTASVMLRIEGSRHEMAKALMKIHTKEVAFNIISDVYLPYDDPDENDTLDMDIRDMADLVKYVCCFKEFDLVIFNSIKSPFLKATTTISNEREPGVHIVGSVENEAINANLQGRIDKAIENLKGSNT